MAIAFYVPSGAEEQTAAAGTSQEPTPTSSSSHSPSVTPSLTSATINPNEFIQAFRDALYRYSLGGESKYIYVKN